jgi:hypothetical protein
MMITNSEVENYMSNPRPFSRLNWPTRELVPSAHRERGLLLRAMITSVVRRVSLAFVSRRSGARMGRHV